uniref:Uncharacterized protein n=2 Tax=Aegilops tauschii subsp. strangulata TaxID=200361 RepID=A0A453LHS4_AEGTS
EVYTEVLARLHAAEERAPGFDDDLWSHFNRLPARYAMDVNVERAEDVLTHKRLLELAKDPAQRPAFAVRAVQVTRSLLLATASSPSCSCWFRNAIRSATDVIDRCR